jgi:hypothetical protein
MSRTEPLLVRAGEWPVESSAHLLRRRLVAAADVAEVAAALEEELPPAGLRDVVLRLGRPDVPWEDLARLGPCVALQPLGDSGARGLLAYAPAGDDLPLVADVLRHDLSQVLDALADAVTADTPRPRSP